PTTPVRPGPIKSSVGSTKDLNPTSLSRVICTYPALPLDCLDQPWPSAFRGKRVRLPWLKLAARPLAEAAGLAAARRLELEGPEELQALPRSPLASPHRRPLRLPSCRLRKRSGSQ